MTDKLSKSFSDVPSLVLEQVTDYLDLADLTALRSVNRKCHDVLSADKFWKRYLKYPEKYFLCDLISKSTLPGVAEVIEEISLGTVSKWLGYLKLQHIHLQNWASGETHKVELKPSTPFCNIEEAIDMVDTCNQHWLFLSDNKGFIYIWNVTEKPRELEPVSIGYCERMILSPQGKVLIEKMDENDKIYMEVYKFENPEYVLTLQCKIYPSINSNDGCYLEMDNILLFYKSHVSFSYQPPLVNIWDWHLGLELATVDLSNDELFFKTKSQSNTLSMKFRQGVFPNSLLVVSDSIISVQVNIFNLEVMRITHVVDFLDISMSHTQYFLYRQCSCGMIFNHIYIWLENYDDCGGTIRLYSFTRNQIHLLFISRENEMVNSNLVEPFQSRVLETTKTKIVFKTHRDFVRVIDITVSFGVKDYKCRVNTHAEVFRFIEPNLLFVDDSGSLKVFNIFSGKKLFSLNRSVSLLVCVIPEYPSKIIIIDVNDNKMNIFNF